MDKQLLDEVLACLGNERQVVPYFKDKFCVDTLKRFVGDGTSVQAVKKCPFSGFLNKPWIKQRLAECGHNCLDKNLLSTWWKDELFYFDQTLGQWGGEAGRWQQTTRNGYNVVLQLNFTKSHDRDYDSLPCKYGLHDGCGCHPIHQGNRYTMAWARMDFSEDLSEVLIEEIQTDWLRDAKCSLRYLKNPRKRFRDSECQRDKQRFEYYFTTHLAPLMTMWDEAILNATLNFLFDNVGVQRVYYHDFDTGNMLKNISYCQPPRSLYSNLPKRFGMLKTQELPLFLQQRQVKKTWGKLTSPCFYFMNSDSP